MPNTPYRMLNIQGDRRYDTPGYWKRSFKGKNLITPLIGEVDLPILDAEAKWHGIAPSRLSSKHVIPKDCSSGLSDSEGDLIQTTLRPTIIIWAYPQDQIASTERV